MSSDTKGSERVLVDCQSISKKFGPTMALNDLSFQVKEGTVSGLLGANGSGKTTSIKILLGLANPTSGRSELMGVGKDKAEFKQAVQKTGSLIEGPALYGRATARQNMEIYAAAKGVPRPKEEIARLLNLVGLSDRANTKANGFSLGMKQRLGLAIALLGNPELVILDEPTNGLDPSGIVEIRELIMSLPAAGTTVLVSSHLLSEVEIMCDRATIIDHGKLVVDGSIDEILATSGTTDSFVIRVEEDNFVQTRKLFKAYTSWDVEHNNAHDITISGPKKGFEITKFLADNKIYLDSLRTNQVNLEEAFLRLTGNSSGDTSSGHTVPREVLTEAPIELSYEEKEAYLKNRPPEPGTIETGEGN